MTLMNFIGHLIFYIVPFTLIFIAYKAGEHKAQSRFQFLMRLAGEGNGLDRYILPFSAQPNETIDLEIGDQVYRYHRETAQCGWHAPGIGEIHAHDHSYMLYCEKSLPFNEEGPDHSMDDELAQRLCAHLNKTGFVVPLNETLLSPAR